MCVNTINPSQVDRSCLPTHSRCRGKVAPFRIFGACAHSTPSLPPSPLAPDMVIDQYACSGAIIRQLILQKQLNTFWVDGDVARHKVFVRGTLACALSTRSLRGDAPRTEPRKIHFKQSHGHPAFIRLRPERVTSRTDGNGSFFNQQSRIRRRLHAL